MPPRSLLALLLALALAAAGCRPAAPPEPPPPPEAPPPPAAPTPPPPAPEAVAEEVAAEVRAHDLSVPEVRRYGQAVEAVARLAEEDPDAPGLWEDLEARLARAESVEEVQAVLDADPRVRRALEEAGLSSRDYVLTGTALLGAYQVVLAREEGDPDPPRPDYVTDAHLRFVEQNRAEADAVVARLQAVYGVDFDELLEEGG